MKFNYCLPDLEGVTDENVFIDSAHLTIHSPLPGAKIYYTTNGSVPNLDSKVLNRPLLIKTPSKIRFAAITPNGNKSELYEVHYKEGQWKMALENLPKLQPGLQGELYNGSFKNTKAITGDIIRKISLKNVELADTIKLSAFAALINGFINVPETGIYSFFLTCDDGGVLKIDNDIVVDNDGNHSAVERSGQIALKKGLHKINVDFIEAG